MLRPAVRREVVAHLQAARGPVGTAGLLHRPAPLERRYRSCRLPETDLRGTCASLRRSEGALAIGGCSSCCNGRASRHRSTALPALPGRRADSAQAPGADERWARERRFGRGKRECAVVSCMTSSLGGGASGPENRWRCDARMPRCSPDTSISGHRVARALTVLICRRGRSGHVRFGPRHRVHLERDPCLVEGSLRRVALHRARKADAERLHRELQQQNARCTPEREPRRLVSITPAAPSLNGPRTTTPQGLNLRSTAGPSGFRRDPHPRPLRRCAQWALRVSAGCSTRVPRRNRNGRGSNRESSLD